MVVLKRVFSETVVDEDGEIVYTRTRPRTISGVQKKIRTATNPIPRQFQVLIHYHYPLVIFPSTLKNEIEQLEDFFDIKANQRGEGTIVHKDRLLATMSYRVTLRDVNALGFSKALRETLNRYGVEIISYKLLRT